MEIKLSKYTAEDYYTYKKLKKSQDTIGEYIKKQLYLQEYKDFIGEDLVTEEDFKNQNIIKYYAYYDYIDEDINIGDHQVIRVQGCIYSKLEQKIWDFVNKIGRDDFKKYVLEVKDEDKCNV